MQYTGTIWSPEKISTRCVEPENVKDARQLVRAALYYIFLYWNSLITRKHLNHMQLKIEIRKKLLKTWNDLENLEHLWWRTNKHASYLRIMKCPRQEL